MVLIPGGGAGIYGTEFKRPACQYLDYRASLMLERCSEKPKDGFAETSGHGCQGTYFPVQVPFANVVGDANIVAELVTC